MQRVPSALVLAVAVAVAVAACGAGGGTGTLLPSAAAPSSGVTPGPTATPSTSTASIEPDSSSEPSAVAGVVLEQAWATATLTDVETGATFRIADLVASGRTVFVEPMAIWCTKCRAQQADAMTALASLDRSRVSWIAIDVESSETAPALAEYEDHFGFDFDYALADADLARALAADFGDRVLSPTSTPIVVIGPDGTVTLTEFGHKSVERILELAAAHGA
jgi:thiol-disulfide isomerase/thioredoxin